MLNCFEGYKRCTCIHISNDILDFVQQKTRITMDNGIDQISRNIPSLASEELIYFVSGIHCGCIIK